MPARSQNGQCEIPSNDLPPPPSCGPLPPMWSNDPIRRRGNLGTAMPGRYASTPSCQGGREGLPHSLLWRWCGCVSVLSPTSEWMEVGPRVGGKLVFQFQDCAPFWNSSQDSPTACRQFPLARLMQIANSSLTPTPCCAMYTACSNSPSMYYLLSVCASPESLRKRGQEAPPQPEPNIDRRNSATRPSGLSFDRTQEPQGRLSLQGPSLLTRDS